MGFIVKMPMPLCSERKLVSVSPLELNKKPSISLEKPSAPCALKATF